MSGDKTTHAMTADALVGFSLHEAPGHLLRRCQQLAVDLYTVEVGSDGLTPRQFALLLAIYQKAGISQVVLVRQRTENDRRTNALAVTPEGERQLRLAQPGVMRAQDRLMEPIPTGRRAEFVALLQQMIESLEQRP